MSETKQYDGPLPVGALWKKISGKGTNYLFIKLELKDELGTPKVSLFRAYRNQFKKEGDNLPDFKIYNAEDDNGKKSVKPVEKPKIKKSVKTDAPTAPDTGSEEDPPF